MHCSLRRALAAGLAPLVLAAGGEPQGAGYRLIVDGRVVASLSRLTSIGTPADYRLPGGLSARKSPGRSRYEAITLERGVTQDSGFQSWANQTSRFGDRPGAETATANLRKDVDLQFLNEAGQPTQVYHFKRCWVAEYPAPPKLGADANAVALQRIKLECEVG